MPQATINDLKKMNSSEYKLYHESFMQNNHGSTAFHTFLCILFTILCSLYCSIGLRRPGIKQYAFEYLLIVLPMISAHTFLAEHIPLLNVIAFALLAKKYVRNYPKIRIGTALSKLNHVETRRIHSVTIIRALTYLITVFAILAVDFQCFPRHLAKTERFGYSLMDTGVGLFVLMSGVAHKELKKDNVSAIIKGNTKLIVILLCLGAARFWSVKQLDYQEHVTEYGVHWNFFFTLAFCKLLSTIILYCSNHALFFSIMTLIVHEFLLWLGLQAWVFSGESRNDLLSANREGISSCLGYISMYLFAAYFKTKVNDQTVTRSSIICKMTVGSILLWTACIIVSYYRPASRTLANSGYCIYLEATFLSITTFMYFIEIQFQDSENKSHFDVPLILSAINRNGLLYFLIANLMTGIINLSMRTLLISNSVAVIIFILYMAVSLILSMYLVHFGIKL